MGGPVKAISVSCFSPKTEECNKLALQDPDVFDSRLQSLITEESSSKKEERSFHVQKDKPADHVTSTLHLST